MDVNNIIQFELEQFKNGLESAISFNQINESSTKKVLSKALNDAFAMAVKRFKTKYKDIENQLLNEFIIDYVEFATEDVNMVAEQFTLLFDELVSKFIRKMNEFGKPYFATYGFAQKFISMSFKYMYCFDNARRNKFKYCKLPLDKYTINWYKKYGNKNFIKQFKNIGFAWSELDEGLYKNIQQDIDKLLQNGCDYNIKCNNPKEIVRLPENKIEVEFIIWQQERLNEVYNNIQKFSEYFERLGINIE